MISLRHDLFVWTVSLQACPRPLWCRGRHPVHHHNWMGHEVRPDPGVFSAVQCSASQFSSFQFKPFDPIQEIFMEYFFFSGTVLGTGPAERNTSWTNWQIGGENGTNQTHFRACGSCASGVRCQVAWGMSTWRKCLSLAAEVGEGLTQVVALGLGLREAGGYQEVGEGGWRTGRFHWPRNGPAQVVTMRRCFYQSIPFPLRRREYGLFLSVLKPP